MTTSNPRVMRQVQLIVGCMVLAGSYLAWQVTPYGLLLTTLAGAGLLMASITGVCPMERVLARMPWNCPAK